MITAALQTLLVLPGWLVLVGLVGYGLLWPLRRHLQGLGNLASMTLAWWMGYLWLGWATMGMGTIGALNGLGLGLLLLPALLGAWGGWQARGLGLKRHEFYALLALLGLALLSLPTALTPPTEADTLAYHFALPKLYAAAGKLVFAPVAITFASPQLTHMVSTWALVMGHEPLLLAQAWGNSLMAAVAVLALASLWLPLRWACVVAMVFLGTPVMTYAFSNGSVELRQAGLMAAAAVAFALYAQQRRLGLAVAFAALLGGVVASKIFGLFVLPAAALMWFGQYWRRYDARFWRHTAAVVAVGLAVAAPWYISAYVQYGSPVFPVLAAALGSPDWSAAQQAYMERAYLANELMIPRTLETLFSYPFIATFAGALLDSDRTGLGPLLPLGLLAAVVVLAQGWRTRAMPPLAWLLVLALGYYLLWFVVGVSGRSRHLLTILPLLLVALAVVLHAWWPRFAGWVRLGLMGCFLVVLLAQSGMALVLNRTALQALWQGQSRSAYLHQQVTDYTAVTLSNQQLRPTDRVLVVDLRTTIYYLQTPYFHNADFQTQLIPVATGNTAQVWQALQAHGFTAWLAQQGSSSKALLADLQAHGCAHVVAEAEGFSVPSRTLATRTQSRQRYLLYRFTPQTCPLGSPMLQTFRNQKAQP